MKRLLLCALLGLVFVPSAVSRPRAAVILLNAPFSATTAPAPGPLTYHGGRVMKTQVVHTIYWLPLGFSYGAGYQEALEQFISDVAADSGQPNVFSVMTEYGDAAGKIAYSLANGGSAVVTNAIPKNDVFCNDTYTSYCVRETNIEAALNSAITVHGWAKDYRTAYVLVLPQNVGYRTVAAGYAYSGSCGFHYWHTTSASSALLYAVVPFQNWAGKCNRNDSVTQAVSVTSHELIEVFTDPDHRGWYATDGEIADKCQTVFQDQTINENSYRLQGEWSNAIGACAWGG